MGAWAARQTRDRYDRHVRRAQLSVDSGAPLHRLAFAVEEALRLASLPGENEGRSYYFRHLNISGLPSDGNRSAWLEQFQRALGQEAEHALHGADPRAASVQAVFFRGEQEALEILLHRILARRPVNEWFWPMVTAAPSADGPASNAAMVLHIVERLRAQPASWTAVAVALFATQFDVVRLLEAIPPAAAQGWIREMDGSRPAPSRAPARIPASAQAPIQQALKIVGFRDIRVVWLTTLAVLLDSPAALAAGTAVWSARGILQQLISEGKTRLADRKPPDAIETGRLGAATPARPGTAEAVTPAHGEDIATGSSPRSDAQADVTPPDLVPVTPLDIQLDAEAANSGTLPLQDALRAFDMSAGPEPAIPVPASDVSGVASEFTRLPDTTPWQCTGLPTGAAGLFFLLNALERLGVSEAMATDLASVAPNFVTQVLHRLALYAGVADDDPIKIWLDSVVPSVSDEEPLPCEPSWWPANLVPDRYAAPLEYVLRVWCLAVRRWCWRTGKVTVRDVVSRAGVFSVSRTDLDVSLPIEEADIRVRRIGLDLDPGWLPWFGRVVRFHYLFRGEFHG
jgi:hypothetical protein